MILQTGYPNDLGDDLLGFLCLKPFLALLDDLKGGVLILATKIPCSTR